MLLICSISRFDSLVTGRCPGSWSAYMCIWFFCYNAARNIHSGPHLGTWLWSKRWTIWGLTLSSVRYWNLLRRLVWGWGRPSHSAIASAMCASNQVVWMINDCWAISLLAQDGQHPWNHHDMYFGISLKRRTWTLSATVIRFSISTNLHARGPCY